MNRRKHARRWLTIGVATTLLAPTAAFAAGGGGGGGGSGSGDTYSDLVVALRAENGTPILKRFMVPAEDPTDPATPELCVQPASYSRIPGVTASENPLDERQVWIVPLQGEWLTDPPAQLPVEEIEACDPQPQYAMFATEVELERLNLARTSDDVMARKTAAVETKLTVADTISLDGAGRITPDGVPIDAAPEHAAIYQSLLKTGTIPGLPADLAGPPALVGPPTAQTGGNSQFDAWELAAASLGTAASKEVPINVDSVLYYNRVIGFPGDDFAPTAGWNVEFNRSLDPDTGVELTTGEQFIDYSGFSYNRSETFRGSVTWLDVDNLEWQVVRIADLAEFTNLAAEPIGTRTLTGVTAFAQLADDVRAIIWVLHEHEVIPGFYMDPVGIDTTAAQQQAIIDPAVSLSGLPDIAFQSVPFDLTTTVFNPWGGTSLAAAELRIGIDAPTALVPTDVTSIATPGGTPISFSADPDGDLVGTWGAPGFPVEPGAKIIDTFTTSVAEGAPTGPYTLELELVDAADPGQVLASTDTTIEVMPNAPAVLWGGSVLEPVTQGTPTKVPLTVYAPPLAPDAEPPAGELVFTLSGPGDDPLTPEVIETMRAGDAKVYGEAPAGDGTDMVAMPLTLVDDKLVGSWPLTLTPGFQDVLWYLTVTEGALEGVYQLDVELVGGNAVPQVDVIVVAPEEHGDQPPGTGEDSTAPTVVIDDGGLLGQDVAFALSTAVPETDVTFEARLIRNGTADPWTDVTTGSGGYVSYTKLSPGLYTFEARATDAAGNLSFVTRRSWVVDDPTAPTTQIVSGPADNTWVLDRSATFVLSSDATGDVEYLVTVNGRTFSSGSETIVVNRLKPGSNQITFAAMKDGKTDATPAERFVSVPKGVAQARRYGNWRLRSANGHLFGTFAQTSGQGHAIAVSAWRIKQLILVVSTGKGHGKVNVYFNDTLLTPRPISLRSATARGMVVVPVATFAAKKSGTIRVEVVSDGKPVRIEGIGVSSW